MTELAGFTLGGGFEIFEPGFRTPLAKYGNYQEDGGVGNAGTRDKEMFTFEINIKY